MKFDVPSGVRAVPRTKSAVEAAKHEAEYCYLPTIILSDFMDELRDMKLRENAGN